MPSRSVRRRKHKQLHRMLTAQNRHRMGIAGQYLMNWQSEARRRAKWLGAPAVWRLAADSHIRAIIAALDPSGELLADLLRVCAEAIAEVVDRRMIHSSRSMNTCHR